MPMHGPAAALDADPAPSGARRALLVVDDDSMVRVVIARALRRQGYQVLEAVNAEAALTILSQQTPQVGVVLSDDRMPGMSGRELAIVVSRVYPGVRVVLMSGYVSEDATLPNDPSVRVLAKPFSTSELIETVAAAFG